MSPTRRIVPALLAASLVLTAGSTLAQPAAEHWTVSDDGLAYATNDTADVLPDWDTVAPPDFPEAISGLQGPPFLYRLDETVGTGTRVARMVDVGSVTGLPEGRTPIIASAVVDDDGGVTWARQQHIVSMPEPCPGGQGRVDCLDPNLVPAFVDLSAPDGTPAAAFGADAPFGVIAGATIDDDGTIFSLSGDASVSTTLRVREDGKIAARGSADISQAIGGTLRGFEAIIVEDSTDQGLQALLEVALEDRARAVGRSRPNAKGVYRSILECPPSGRGHVISQFLVRGVGGNIGPAINEQLSGGVPLLITEVRPFACTPPTTTVLELPDGPAAAVVCAWARPRHQTLTVTTDGQSKTYNSSFLLRYILAAVGLSPEPGEAKVSARVGDASGGRFVAGDAELVGGEGAWDGVDLFVGETVLGINAYGPKPYRDLQFSAGGQNFDLADGWRQLLGDEFDVGPGQKPITNCPDVEFTTGGVQEIFADGFESGDLSAWTESIPD